MKRNQDARGFTLIELLVVITVIAILMALLFPAFRGVQDQAKRTQAKNDVTQVVTAVTAFYTEYGRYPVPGAPGGPDYWIDGGNSQNLMDVLRADGLSWDSSTGENLNPKRISFLSPPYAKDATNPRSGIAPGVGANAGKYYDPWGSIYRFRIDWDYDNNLVNPYTQGAGNTPLSLGVIGFSVGKDQVSDADNDSGKRNVPGETNNGDDDVISWQ